MSPPEPLATCAEVAAYLRTTEPQLTQSRYKGVGPRFVKHGRRVLYRWSDVREWEERNTLQCTADRPR